MKHLPMLLAGLVTSACLSGPSFLKGGGAALTSDGTAKTPAAVLSDTNGIMTAAVDPHSAATQMVQASSSSAIAGTQIAFPPGSLAIATNITVQEGTPLASSSFTQQLGLDPAVTVKSASATVVLQSSTPIDAAQPFTIAIAVSTSSLALADQGVNYAVLYNSYFAADGANRTGVIPATALTMVGGKVSFQTQHFGAYQLISSSVPITEKKEVASTQPIVTAHQAAAAPIALDNFTPVVAGAGATVSLVGKNFRPTMTVALGGRPVGKVTVASDVSASFVVPAEVPFGFTDLTVVQDGASETHKLFAMADRTGLPLITVDPAGVCAGVKYFDASGNQQVGTMTCLSAQPTAPATGDMLKSVYDKDSSGKVDQAKGADHAAAADKATVATTAGSAATAATANQANFATYALGAAGSAITVSGSQSQLQIPGDGSTYVVSGSGTITSLAAMPIGTKVGLVFASGAHVKFNHSETAPRLLMTPGTAIDFIGGDGAEFVSLGSGNWAQVSQVYRPALFSAALTTGTLPANVENGQAYNPIYASDSNVWPTVLINAGNAYQNGVFTVPYTGTYAFNGGIYGEFTAQNNATCNIVVYKNANTTPIMQGTNGYQDYSAPYECATQLSGYTAQLTAGDQIEVKAFFGYTGGSGTVTVKPSGQQYGATYTTFIKISKVN